MKQLTKDLLESTVHNIDPFKVFRFCKASGRSVCGSCSQVIKAGEPAVQVELNARSSYYHHARCLMMWPAGESTKVAVSTGLSRDPVTMDIIPKGEEVIKLYAGMRVAFFPKATMRVVIDAAKNFVETGTFEVSKEIAQLRYVHNNWGVLHKMAEWIINDTKTDYPWSPWSFQRLSKEDAHQIMALTSGIHKHTNYPIVQPTMIAEAAALIERLKREGKFKNVDDW